MNKLTSRIQTLSTEMLKDIAQKLNGDFRDGADEAQSAVLDELMARLPETDFVAFCEAM